MLHRFIIVIRRLRFYITASHRKRGETCLLPSDHCKVYCERDPLSQNAQRRSVEGTSPLLFTLDNTDFNSITSHANASRQVTANEAVNKAAYATIAPGISPSPFELSKKFRVPFDEGPSIPTLDNIVEDVESIPEAVSKERGYQIIGEVKAPQDELMKILAVGDMRIWQ